MDKELDDLLDSVLNDFDASPAPEPATAATTFSKRSEISIEKTDLYVDDIDYEDRPVRKTMPDLQQPKQTSILNDELFDEIFNDAKSKESMKQFQSAFEMLKSGKNDPKMLENFQKIMTDLANTDLGDDNDDEDDDFEKLPGFEFFKNLTNDSYNQKEINKPTETSKNTENQPNKLKKVLDDMNKNSEKVLKNDSIPGNDFLSSLINSLSSENASASGDDNLDSASSLMMQPILSMLFSKEILYPSLKLMDENFNKYIFDKKDSLSEDEYKKCLNQKECIEKMCIVYEESKETDSQEAKTTQLKKILDLLEKCGVIKLFKMLLYLNFNNYIYF